MNSNAIIPRLTSLLLLILSISFSQALAQTGTIEGTVATNNQQPLSDINISLEGTRHGAATEADGRYQINKIPAGSYTLVASGVGFQTQKEQITIEPGQTYMVNFTLIPANEQLQEVLVEGEQTNKFSIDETEYVARMPLEKLENPQVYSTITKELMEEQLSFSVDDALNNAPGITKMWDNTGRSGDGSSFYNMRGFIVQSQLRNGIAGNVSTRIDAANLERVEVMKGPSATLFGNVVTSYGGLINRVTKKPYNEFGGEVSYTAGNFEFNRISADINTPLNTEKNILLRVNTAYNYEGSFQDNGFDQNLALTSSLSYQVNNRLSFLFDTEFYTGQNTGLGVFFFPPGQTVTSLGVSKADELNIDYRRSYASDDLYQTSRNTNIFGQMDYRISGQWRSQTNITVTNSFSDGPSPYFYLLSNAAVTGNPGDTGNDYISRNEQSTDNSRDRVIELQQNFIGEFETGSTKHKFVAGVDLFHHNSDQLFTGVSYDIIPVEGTIPNYRAFNKAAVDSIYMDSGTSFYYPIIFTANTYSAYASDMVNITGNLSALAALRIDHFSHKGNYDANTGSTSGGYHQTELSPKFGVVFQPVQEKVSIFGNYQNSFTNEQGADVEGNTFRPEQANQIEGGIKLNVFDGRLRTTLSYYDIKVKDIIRTDPDNPNFSIQDGTRISRGAEADVKANPFEGLNLVAGFAYNYSKYEEADEDIVDRRPDTASSPYTANLWVSYRLPENLVKGLGFGFGGNYASDNKVINSANIGVFTLPAYTILNASAFYDSSRFRFAIKANNLTNKKYWIGYTTVNPQMLRQVMGNITFKF